MSKDEKTESAKKRPLSFTLRLTWQQFLRMFQILFLTNLLIIVIFLGVCIASSEAEMKHISQMSDIAQVNAYAKQQRDISLSFIPAGTGNEGTGAWGIFSGEHVSGRGLRLESDESARFLWFERRLFYVAVISFDAENSLEISFDLGEQAGAFTCLFQALLIVEAFVLLLNTLGTRKDVKRTLAPIQRLAGTAHGIQPPPQAAAKPAASAPAELKLTNTIDALNMITAKKLDFRISIEDERPELKGLAKAINEMLDRVDEAYSSQLRFVSDASHELRTPIAVIQGYANLLDRWGKEDPKALQESIDAIKHEAENMQTLVEQLLFLARSDNNSIVLRPVALDLSQLANEVLRETQVIDRTHAFSSDIDPNLYVEGDPGLLKQAVRIFMDNAIKYTPPGGDIKVSVRETDGLAELFIRDSGIGIEERDIENVFERFYRSDESRARKTGGTGLGLSIAKWIVARHGGHVSVLSRKDIGTRVGLSLPIISPPVSEAPTQNERDSEAK